jgi:hypothetical protein
MFGGARLARFAGLGESTSWRANAACSDIAEAARLTFRGGSASRTAADRRCNSTVASCAGGAGGHGAHAGVAVIEGIAGAAVRAGQACDATAVDIGLVSVSGAVSAMGVEAVALAITRDAVVVVARRPRRRGAHDASAVDAREAATGRVQAASGDDIFVGALERGPSTDAARGRSGNGCRVMASPARMPVVTVVVRDPRTVDRGKNGTSLNGDETNHREDQRASARTA